MTARAITCVPSYHEDLLLKEQKKEIKATESDTEVPRKFYVEVGRKD